MTDNTTTIKKLKCENCGKKFEQERYLRQHKNKRTPCTKKFVCTKCDKQFPTSSKLQAHKNRKNPCVPNEIPVIKGDNEENRCQFCNKTYSNAYSLKRHQNESCDTNKNMQVLLKKIEEQEEKIALLKENALLREQLSQQSQTIINNTMNIHQNNYVNVTICSFGSEDFNKLDASKVMQLLRGQVKDFMSKMIEYIHANPDHPERHNVFYDPVRKKAIVLVPISDTEMSWQTRDFREVSDILTDKIKDHVAPGNGPYFDLAMKDKDYDTSNNIINIAKHTNWKTDEFVQMNQHSLTTLTKNPSFMNQVKVLDL